MSEAYSPDSYMVRRLRARYPDRYREDGQYMFRHNKMQQAVEVDLMAEAADGKFGTLEFQLVLKNRRQFFFRMWLATKLAQLAAWVAPVPTTVEQVEETVTGDRDSAIPSEQERDPAIPSKVDLDPAIPSKVEE